MLKNKINNFFSGCLLLMVLSVTAFSQPTIGAATPTPDSPILPVAVEEKYEVAQISYERVEDGSLGVRVSFEKNPTGRISESDVNDNLILCAKNVSANPSNNDPIFRDVRKVSTESLTNHYKVEIGEHLGSLFRLKNGWTNVSFHIERSLNGQCRSTNIREPSTYDIQINRNFDTIPETKVGVGDVTKWEVDANSSPQITKGIEIEITTNRCDTFDMELKRGIDVYARKKGVVICRSNVAADATRIRLDIADQFKASFVREGLYSIFANGKLVKDVQLNLPIPEYKLNSVDLFNGVDSTAKRIEANKNFFLLNDISGPKTLVMKPTSPGTLSIKSEDDCIRIERLSSSDSSNHNYSLDFSQCKENLYSLNFSGQGMNAQELVGSNNKYYFRIANETRFDGVVSFGYKDKNTILKYKLTRDVVHSIEVVARLTEGQETSLSINEKMDASKKQDGFYVAEITQAWIDTIRQQSGVQTALKAGKTVPIIFKLVDQNPDASHRNIGEFEVQAYGIDNNAVTEVLSKSQKLTKDEAINYAKRILGIENVQESALSPDQQLAKSNLTEVLGFSDVNKRSKTMKILSIFGNVGLRLLGLPISF